LNYLKDLNLYSVCGLQTSSALIELFLKVLKLGRAACRGAGPNGLGTIKRFIICQGNATQAAVITDPRQLGQSLLYLKMMRSMYLVVQFRSAC
jgi:hypothetical protein